MKQTILTVASLGIILELFVLVRRFLLNMVAERTLHREKITEDGIGTTDLRDRQRELVHPWEGQLAKTTNRPRNKTNGRNLLVKGERPLEGFLEPREKVRE